jgi:hypothetical protein
MSLSSPQYTAEFIRDWRAHGERGERFIMQAFTNWRGVVESCEFDHRWPADWKPADCRRSLDLLRRAVNTH